MLFRFFLWVLVFIVFMVIEVLVFGGWEDFVLWFVDV